MTTIVVYPRGFVSDNKCISISCHACFLMNSLSDSLKDLLLVFFILNCFPFLQKEHKTWWGYSRQGSQSRWPCGSHLQILLLHNHRPRQLVTFHIRGSLQHLWTSIESHRALENFKCFTKSLAADAQFLELESVYLVWMGTMNIESKFIVNLESSPSKRIIIGAKYCHAVEKSLRNNCTHM